MTSMLPELPFDSGKDVPALARAPSWEGRLRESLTALDERHPGSFGLFVKDLNSGAELSFRGDESWYLASGVKVPIALEVLAREEAGELRLDEKVTLEESDKLDGSEKTNKLNAGRKLSLRWLLEQMLIHSDNAASDLLIRRVGLERVNERVRELVPEGFGPITTLSDVRRLAYSEFSRKAAGLSNSDFLALKAEAEGSRVRKLASVLHESEERLRHSSLAEGFESYYARGHNSGTLRAYASLLEKAAEGSALGEAQTDYFFRVMRRVATGRRRLRAGLGAGIVLAHKTGTQHRRVCDFGVAWPRKNPGKKVVIAACTRGFVSAESAENVLAAAGRAVLESGVFSSR